MLKLRFRTAHRTNFRHLFDNFPRYDGTLLVVWMLQPVEGSDISRFNSEIIPVVDIHTELLGDCLRGHLFVFFIDFLWELPSVLGFHYT